ncbi:MAG TPA: hypothetical protein VF267_13955 [Gammaproteobacteria bacterium]
MACVVSGALLLAACADPPPPEQRIRTFIAQTEQQVENREFTELVARIAGDYLDSHGNDKLKAAGILRAFYLRYKTVYLHVRIADIRLPSPDRAAVRLYVAMAQRPFPESGNLPDADFFRLDLELAVDGDSYEVLQSEWQRASAADVVF